MNRERVGEPGEGGRERGGKRKWESGCGTTLDNEGCGHHRRHGTWSLESTFSVH